MSSGIDFRITGVYVLISLWVVYYSDKRRTGVLEHSGASDHKPLPGVTVMAEKQHTQTRPKDRGFPCFILPTGAEVQHA